MALEDELTKALVEIERAEAKARDVLRKHLKPGQAILIRDKHPSRKRNDAVVVEIVDEGEPRVRIRGITGTIYSIRAYRLL